MRKLLSLSILLALAVPLGADASTPDVSLISVPSVDVTVGEDGASSCARDDAFRFDVHAPRAASVLAAMAIVGVDPSNGNNFREWVVGEFPAEGVIVVPWNGEGFEGVQGAYAASLSLTSLDSEGGVLGQSHVSFGGHQDHRAPQVNLMAPEEGAPNISIPAQVSVGFDERIVTGRLQAVSSVQGDVVGSLIQGVAEITLDPDPPVLFGVLTMTGNALDTWCNLGTFAWQTSTVASIG